MRVIRPRAGFTLIEMLVALALVMFMMAVLSEAFVAGLESMRQLKAISDMQEQLRAAATIIRRDLAAPHFEGARRLGNITTSGRPIPKNLVWSQGDPLSKFLDYRLVTPNQGYFYINEEPARPFDPTIPTRIFEGYDADNRPSDRQYGNEMAMTVRLDGKNRGNMFDGFVDANDPIAANLDVLLDSGGTQRSYLNYDGLGVNQRFMSNWAEVCYFLRLDRNRATAQTTGLADTAGRQLINTFTLYRRQLLLMNESMPIDSQGVASDPFFAAGIDMSAAPAGQQARYFFSRFDLSAYFNAANNSFYLNTPADVQFPQRRFYWPTSNRNGAGNPNHGRLYEIANTQPLYAPNREGSDILLTNVVSFDVQVWDPLALVQVTPPTATPVYRGAFVDIRHPPQPINPPPVPTSQYDLPVVIDGITYNWNPNSPWVEGPQAVSPGYNSRFFDTGCARTGQPGLFPPSPAWPQQNIGGAVYPPLAIPAIQIKIRLWDSRTEQTRQITIIQDM